jgi:hypothetical protein
MPDIFISYRREDSAATCGRIHDHLVAYFGADAIFRDVDNIPVGVDFRQYIKEVMAQCAATVVLIGRHWSEVAGKDGQKRLFATEDPVRTEIELAFELGIQTIPLLVDGAGMPHSSSLPASITQLADVNSAQVRYDPDFQADIKQVITALKLIVETTPPSQRPFAHMIPDRWDDYVELRSYRASDDTSSDATELTAYYPLDLENAAWQSLLVYLHSADTLSAVRSDAQQHLALRGKRIRARYFPLADDLPAAGSEVGLVPRSNGVRFRPERTNTARDSDWARSEFQFQVGEQVAGEATTIYLDLQQGASVLGPVKMPVLCSAPTLQVAVPVVEQTYRFDTIYACYSHLDIAILETVRRAYTALGINVLIDTESLRSGESFTSQLEQLIRRADVFQLFWSHNAARSTYVRKELQYAVSLNRQGFIRPVYWEKPLAPVPDELADLHFAYLNIPQLPAEVDEATQELGDGPASKTLWQRLRRQ